ncbi:MAG: hypothetical protein WCR54_00260 [Clostridia bacterium]
MAVKIHNIETLRRSKRWNEKDDAALCLLLKRKIRDTDIALRESNTPYERSRLKETKIHYRQMLKKITDGEYNGDIIFGELQASANLSARQSYGSQKYADPQKAKKYINSYENMDFDYETAFRKTRYYGFALPFLMTIMVLVFLCIFIMGAFLPTKIKETAEYNGININAMFSYKLSNDLDIEITNNGEWPSGTFKTTKPIQGVKWEDAGGTVPETVMLFHNLGMTSIDISAFDIIKAWFRTPMLKNKRLDFIENLSFMKGNSYYSLLFLENGKSDDLKIVKNADGNYDNSVIIRHIGVYGTIMFMIIAFLFGILSLLFCIVRLFSYTTRKVHIINILCFVFSLLAMISPALATIEGTELGSTFKNYFLGLTDATGYIASTTATAGLGLLFIVPVAIALISMLLPKIMRNRLKKRVSFVPKGNRARNALMDPYIVNEKTLERLV